MWKRWAVFQKKERKKSDDHKLFTGWDSMSRTEVILAAFDYNLDVFLFTMTDDMAPAGSHWLSLDDFALISLNNIQKQTKICIIAYNTAGTKSTATNSAWMHVTQLFDRLGQTVDQLVNEVYLYSSQQEYLTWYWIHISPDREAFSKYSLYIAQFEISNIPSQRKWMGLTMKIFCLWWPWYQLRPMSGQAADPSS